MLSARYPAQKGRLSPKNQGRLRVRQLPGLERLETREMMSGTGLGHLASQDLPSHPIPLVHIESSVATRSTIQVVQNPTAANGYLVRLSATVAATGRTPHGNVNFFLVIHESGKPAHRHLLGSALLSFGQASFSKSLGSPIRNATYQVLAHYGGAVNHFAPSTSPPIQLRYV